jgi:hypothetical protein
VATQSDVATQSGVATQPDVATQPGVATSGVATQPDVATQPGVATQPCVNFEGRKLIGEKLTCVPAVALVTTQAAKVFFSMGEPVKWIQALNWAHLALIIAPSLPFLQ